MTSTTFVPSLTVYVSPVTKKQHHKLTIQFVGSVFVKTAEWLKRLGCKFKSFVNKSAKTVEFTFFYISDAVLQKIAAHNAKRAAELQAAAPAPVSEEDAIVGFDGTVAPSAEKVAQAIAISAAVVEQAKSSGRVHTSAGGGEAPAASAPVVSAPAFVPATVEQISALTKNVLKDMCRQFNLKVSGTKAQLASRLVGHVSAEFCAK